MFKPHFERKFLCHAGSFGQAEAIRFALMGFKRPPSSIWFSTEINGAGEIAVCLNASLPVVDEYVHSCVGFTEGYKKAVKDRAETDERKKRARAAKRSLSSRSEVR